MVLIDFLNQKIPGGGKKPPKSWPPLAKILYTRLLPKLKDLSGEKLNIIWLLRMRPHFVLVKFFIHIPQGRNWGGGGGTNAPCEITLEA